MMSSTINKRKFSPIWPVAASLAMMSLPCAAAVQTESADAKQPNVLLIFADDLGYADTGSRTKAMMSEHQTSTD